MTGIRGVAAIVIATLCGLMTVAPVIAAAKIYWTDTGDPTQPPRIRRANPDGTNVEDVITTGLLEPAAIAIDSDGRKIYWTDLTAAAIYRADLDGQNVETVLVTAVGQRVGLALDVPGGKMYWTDRERLAVQRAGLDGTEVEGLVTSNIFDPSGIALDLDAGKIYWTDLTASAILRADLDGKNIEYVLVTAVGERVGLALDIPGGQMIWTDRDRHSIQQADLKGGDFQDLVTDLDDPSGIALDLAEYKMYWTDLGTRVIHRADLDGSKIETLVTGLSAPVGIAVLADAAIPACDFDVDGRCGTSDIDLLVSVGDLITGVPVTTETMTYDLNMDGTIDSSDRDIWLAEAGEFNGFLSPFKLGDADLDGVVDAVDFIAWNESKFTASLPWSQGNFNGDGLVDGLDFILWNGNKFTSSDAVSAVPEPSVGALIASFWGLALVRGRRTPMLASRSRLKKPWGRLTFLNTVNN